MDACEEAHSWVVGGALTSQKCCAGLPWWTQSLSDGCWETATETLFLWFQFLFPSLYAASMRKILHEKEQCAKII